MAPHEDRCPICGARRGAGTPTRANPTGLILAIVALVALIAAAWLLQRKPDLVASVLPLPTLTTTPSTTASPAASSASSATVTFTPTDAATATPSPSPTISPTATATPSPTPAYTLHTVAAGESIASIAQHYGTSEQELRQLNQLDDNAQVATDQELVVPALPNTTTPTLGPTATPAIGRVVHVVQQGDNLLRIATLYGVTVERLLRDNDLEATAILQVGQELVIEDAALPADAPTPTHTVASPTPTEVLSITHVVVAGEHLGIIASLYDVSAQDIARANGITTESILSIGQKLIIPSTVATPNYSPTPSPVPSETPTPTATHTRTPLPTATVELPPTPTPLVQRDYVQPQLLAPPQQAVYTRDTTPLLNWTSVGILDQDEWYLVRLWYGPEYTQSTTQLTHQASWRLPPELYPNDTSFYEFMWQVVVVRQRYASERYDAISPESVLRTFTWR